MFDVRELSKRCKYKYEVKYIDPLLKSIKKKFFNTKDEINLFKNELENQEILENQILDSSNENFKFRQNLDITISEAVDLYLDSLSNEMTKDTMKYHYRTILCVYGDKKVIDLSKEDIEKWKLIQSNRNIYLTTTHHRLSLLRSAFNYILKKNIINTHCFRDIILSRPKHQKIDPLSINEARKIFKVASDHIKRALVLGISTGARIGPSELFKLKWSDVDFDKDVIYITNADKGANHVKRMVPIRADIKNYLLDWYKADNNDDKTIISYKDLPVKSISGGWKSALKRAGINRRIRPYDLRHTFATLALMYGGDLKCISELMGHTDTKMILKTYQHTTFEQKRNSINNIPNIFSFDETPEEFAKDIVDKSNELNENDKVKFLNILLAFTSHYPQIKYDY